jgi:pantoate--beta-alanine ligase
MRTVHSIKDLRATIKQQRDAGRRIAFVPTMGNLHEGHIALVKRALEIADYVVTSIFVNPMQFGANEDLDAYPKTLAEDQRQLEEVGNHLVFAPTAHDIYPNGMENQTKVNVSEITELHCGQSRPGHFTGVATVVTMLFNMVQPDVAVFGEKDFQQLATIRKLVRDLFIPIQIEGVATVREPDGLAKSSRNGYLSPEERDLAPELFIVLKDAEKSLISNNISVAEIEESARTQLEEKGFTFDYFNIVNSVTLKPAAEGDKNLSILAAAYLGTTRLIDNISVFIKDGLKHP